MVTSLEGFRSSIVVSLRLQIKVGTSLLTVLYFPNSEKTPTTEFSAKFPRKQGYTRDTASRFLVPCQGLAPEPQGQFLPLLPMATTAKNAHENGHILFRFFWVFFAVSNDLCRAKV